MFAAIRDGKVTLHEQGHEGRTFDPTDEGAEKAGEFLAKFPIEHEGLQFSSSIDFPEDYDLPEFDAHEFLDTAMAGAIKKRLADKVITLATLVDCGMLTFEEGKRLEAGGEISPKEGKVE